MPHVAVMGIDPSLTQTGLAVIENGQLVWTKTIPTKGKANDKLKDKANRIFDIANQVGASVRLHNPVLAVLEAPSFGSLHGAPHERSGLWWAIVRQLHTAGVDYAAVSPKQRAKYATGNGNSQKAEVHAYVKGRYATEDLPIKTNDEADAVILAAMGARYLGMPCERGDLDESLLSAMDKVVWR